ncbi:MAG: hypothetical protein ABI333_13075 [bacterium]
MLNGLLQRIVGRINVNLRELGHDVGPWLVDAIPLDRLTRYYAWYGIGPDHPPHFRSRESALAGSYFLGRCEVDHSLVYKSDVRGDELKNAGDELVHARSTSSSPTGQVAGRAFAPPWRSQSSRLLAATRTA